MNVFGLAGMIAPALAVASYSSEAVSQGKERHVYDLPAQDLRTAVRIVARRSGYQLLADAAAVRGKRSKALKGSFTVEEAIAALIEGAGLSFQIRHRTIFIHPKPPSVQSVAAPNIVTQVSMGINVDGSLESGTPKPESTRGG